MVTKNPKALPTEQPELISYVLRILLAKDKNLFKLNTSWMKMMHLGSVCLVFPECRCVHWFVVFDDTRMTRRKHQKW